MSPAINYVKDLVADGYVGWVLTASMIGCAPNWGATIDRGYQADRANGGDRAMSSDFSPAVYPSRGNRVRWPSQSVQPWAAIQQSNAACRGAAVAIAAARLEAGTVCFA
jgi:hypothetical protein